MTTDHRPPRRISLRAFALEVGSHHSTIGTAVRDGRLRDGVRLDKRGRVVVVDADAAAKNWRAVHTPQITELVRLEERERRAKPPKAGGAHAVFVDPDSGFDWTGPELLASQRAHDLLVFALVSVALEGADDRKARAFSKRVAARLRSSSQQRSVADGFVQPDAETLACEVALIVDDGDGDEAEIEGP